MPDKFQVGDVVQLMSGGPNMTVWRVEPHNGVLVAWFDENDLFHNPNRAPIPHEALRFTDDRRETDEFKLGDVVMLKSGGPKMTIGNGSQAGSWSCFWFTPVMKGPETNFFSSACLRRA